MSYIVMTKKLFKNKGIQTAYVSNAVPGCSLQYSRFISDAVPFDHLSQAKNVRDDVLQIVERAEILRC